VETWKGKKGDTEDGRLGGGGSANWKNRRKKRSLGIGYMVNSQTMGGGGILSDIIGNGGGDGERGGVGEEKGIVPKGRKKKTSL